MFSSEKDFKPTQNPVKNREDVRTHLNFSSVKSPLPNKRPLMNHNFQNTLSSSSSTSSSHYHHHDYQNKIGEYHMSRQNPDILDRMYAKATPRGPTPRKSRDAELRAPISHTPVSHDPGDSSSPYSSPVSVESPHQMSLLRRMLNARKFQTSSPRSVVQMAVQGGRGKGPKRVGLLRSGVTSPVVVPIGGRRRKVYQEDVMFDEEGNDSDSDVNGGEEKRDPCSKETVLDALRKKRKRFATPTAESEPEVTLDAPGPAATPSAKRFKSNGSSPDFSGASHRLAFSTSPATSGRGTSDPLPMNTPTSTPATLPAKVGLTNGMGSRKRSAAGGSSGVIRLDDDSDTEHAQTTEVGDDSRETSPSPVLKKMKKKREDSVRMLTTVFTGTDGTKEEPLRRKYPVFCATGVKPRMPAMSSSHQITHEDLQKEREAVSAKLQSFLAKEEDAVDSKALSVANGISVKPTSSTSSGLKLPTISNTALQSSTASSVSGGLANALAQMSSSTSVASGGQKQHVTKSVSFAPLLTQAMTTTLTGSLLTSTLATDGDTNKASSSTLTLQKPSLTTVTSSTTTLPSVTAGISQQAQGGGGGILAGISGSSLKQAALNMGTLGDKLAEKNPQANVTSSGLSQLSLTSSQQQLKFSLQGMLPSSNALISAVSTATSQAAQTSLPTLQSALSSLQATSTGSANSTPSLTTKTSLPSFQSALSSLQTISSGPAKTTGSQTTQNSLQSALASMQSGNFGALSSKSLAPTVTSSSLNSLANSSQFSFSATSISSSAASNQSLSKLSLATTTSSLTFQLNPANAQSSAAQPASSSGNAPTAGLSGLFQSTNATQSAMFQAPQGGSTAKPSLFQTSQQSVQQPLQISGLSSNLQASQSSQNNQASLFQSNPGMSQQPSLFQSSTNAGSQPFPMLQTSGQPPLILGSQANKQPSLFQTTQAGSQLMPFQSSQSGSNPSPFQVSQATSQSSIFQAPQATTKPSPFQTSQAAGQPSLFQTSQSSTSSQQSSLFQTSKPSLFSGNQGTSQSSLFQTSKPSIFPGTQSTSQPSLFQASKPGVQASPFQMNAPKPSSIFQTPSGSQSNSSPLFQTPQASGQSSSSAFNFSAGAASQSSQSNIFNASKASSFVFGTPQQQNTGNLFGQTPSATPSQSGFQFSASKPVQSTPSVTFGAQNTGNNASFNFGSQNATPTPNSGFNFGQATNTPSAVQFGGQQQPAAGGFNFQTPSAGGGNVFNFSKSAGPSTPTSTRPRAKGRSKRK